MKIKLLSCLLIFLMALPLMAAPPKGKSVGPISLTKDTEHYINANKILMFVTNGANYGRDLAGVFGNDYGTYYPYSNVEAIETGADVRSPYYAGGLWVGAIDSATGETRVAISEYNYEYVPGPMAGGTFLPDAAEYRVYHLYSDSTPSTPNGANADWNNWPIDQGAPYIVTEEGDTIPDLVGDQMMWCVLNDADPDAHLLNNGETLPLGIEVRQTVFAFNRENPLGNIVFIKLQVFNKGGRTLQNCYLSMWSDPDLGGAGDDLVGCDTSLDVGFVYNANNDDQYYGSTPPCLGIDFFQGPLVARTAETADLPDGRMWGQTYSDSVNLGMVSFNKYINGTDPDSYGQTYNYMRGLAADGSPQINNETGQPTLFVLTGDPVKGTGDLDFAPDDRRMMQTTGPVTFRPGDSTEILAAVIVAGGDSGDRLTNISVMKYFDQFAQSAYDLEFEIAKPPANPIVTTRQLPGKVVLTWTDTSEVDPGDYPFEGYSVYQGASASGPWTPIATYDAVDGIGQISDFVLDPATGFLEERLVKNGSDAGIRHYFVANQDYILGGNLFDATTYYFRVEAYSYNPDATPRTLTSANRTPLNLTPQAPPAGDFSQFTALDTLEVTHIGRSDGYVYPLVMDPFKLTGDSYMVTFAIDTSVGIIIDTTFYYSYIELDDTCDAYLDPETGSLVIVLCVDTVLDSITVDEPYYDSTYTTYWNLYNTTKDTLLLTRQFNLSGDDNYTVIDGMVMKVAGPPPGMRGYTWTGATRVLTGVNWGGSGFFGGIGVLDEFFVSDLTLAQVENVQIRWTDPGQGQNAYLYNRSAGYAYEGYYPQDFTVWAVTPGSPERQINFAFVENDWPAPHTPPDSLWDPGIQKDSVIADTIYWDAYGGREYFQIMASDYTATEQADYALSGWFNGSHGSVFDVLWGGWLTHRTGSGQPTPGDVFTLIANFVNTTADTFTFTAPAPTIATSGTESQLDAIKAVPNPFYLFGPYDPSPGNYKIKFTHLPTKCTITIYNLSGELVRTIEKNDAGTSEAPWDILTENGLPVASGIYIYVVDAPGFGQKIGKMAVFTEAEVLKIY